MRASTAWNASKAPRPIMPANSDIAQTPPDRGWARRLARLDSTVHSMGPVTSADQGIEGQYLRFAETRIAHGTVTIAATSSPATTARTSSGIRRQICASAILPSTFLFS